MRAEYPSQLDWTIADVVAPLEWICTWCRRKLQRNLDYLRLLLLLLQPSMYVQFIFLGCVSEPAATAVLYALTESEVATRFVAPRPDLCPPMPCASPISYHSGTSEVAGPAVLCFQLAPEWTTKRTTMSVGMMAGWDCHSLKWDLDPRPSAY